MAIIDYYLLLICRPALFCPFLASPRKTRTAPKPSLGAFFCGDPGQNRTGDLPLRRRLLYPTELRNHIKFEAEALQHLP